MTTRIKTNTNPDAKAQEQLEGVQKMLGNKPNIFTTLAHSSAALGFYLNGIEALSKTHLPTPLREQLALTVAGKNNCDYCASAHTAFGKMQKIDPTELQQNLMHKSKDKKIQAALDFASAIVELRGKVSDADLQAVRDAGYSEAEIVEIIAVVCQNIFTNYFNLIAGTEVDFPLVSTSET